MHRCIGAVLVFVMPAVVACKQVGKANAATTEENAPSPVASAPPAAPPVPKVPWDKFALEEWVQKEVLEGQPYPIRVISLDVVSEGTTKSLPAAIARVRYTISMPMTGVSRECDYFHVAYDKEWKTFNDIVFGYDPNGSRPEECSMAKLVRGYGKPFKAVVTELGYTGKIE